jgi:exodeoxyribonuclease V alpha subunit
LKRRRSEDVFLSHLNLRAENRPDSVFQCPAILPEDAAGEIMKCLSDGFRFLILSGGPGTGKTTTIARLLSLIREGSRIGARRSVRIALTAPTGRAAARLGEALSGEESGSTLHSLLGLAPHRPPKHSCEDPLPYDLVIVDEASMVDLPTMNLLLDALSPSSVLLLVGDPDQLPSVEAGALLGDLLSGLEKAVEGRTVSPLKDTVFTLRKVYRSHTSILSSASAVRDGRLEAFLESGRDDGVRIHPLLSPEKTAALIASSFQDAFELGRQHSEPDTTLFDAYAARGILTPLRRGLWGVAALNDRISLLLGGRTLPFAGMPLMVTGNDRSRNLWNGDKGVLLEKEGRLRAFFPAASEGFREYSLAALPGWEPAWIQTIHKSQGSEFDAVTILLPPGADRILSREILYTALTRARHTADLYSDPETIAVSLERKVSRNSRIRDWAAGI